MANTKKRVLSLLMALVMTLGLFPISALAANSAGQISDHYAPTVEGKDVTWTESDTDTVTDETNGVTVQKEIDGTDQENEFDITLNVTTKEQLENLAVSPDAAVVVVLDVSGSMKDDLGGKQKLAQAKAAAKKFVTSLAEGAEGARRMVSVVQFDTDAIAVQPWINAVGAADSINSTIDSKVTPQFEYHECEISGEHTHEESYISAVGYYDWDHNGFGKGYTCRVCKQYGTTRLDEHDHCTFTGCTQKTDTKHKHTVSYSGPHGEMKTSGNSTNIEAGLQLASNLLTQLSGLDGCNKIDKRYVVLLSDGAPNRIISSSADRTSTTFIKGTEGEKDKTLAAAVATQIRATDGKAATLYAISYAEHTKKDELDKNAKWLKRDIASPNGFFDAASNETLDLAFEKINEQIKLLAQAWTVDDPMGEDVSFVRFNDGVDGDNEIRKEDGGTIHWDLKRDTPKHSGDNTYTYSLSYRVKLNTVKDGFDEAIDHRTNGLTTLKYVVTKDGVVPENPKVLQLNFNVPSVKGTVPTLHYSIEYYLQETAEKEAYDNYTKCAELKGLSAKMHTPVSVTDKDPDYQDNYNAQNYHWVKSNPESTRLTKDNTVLKVYYDHDMVDIAVNHYLTTTSYDKDGKQTVTENVLQPESNSNLSVPKGEPYTAQKLTDTGDVKYADYQFVSGDPTIQKVDGKEIINLYYSVTKDARAKGTIAVFHQLNQLNWVLENGVYTQKLTEGTPAQVGSIGDIRAHDTFETPKTTTTDGYTYIDATCDTSDVTVKDSTVSIQTVEGKNELYLTFTKAAPELPAEKALIKVTHTYTKDVTTIVDGAAVRDQEAHADIVEYKPVDALENSIWYAGENRTVTADKTQPDANSTDIYTVVGDASKTIEGLAAGTNNEVTFQYALNRTIEKTAAKVNFIYRTWETVTVKDEDGNETTEKRIIDAATVTNPVDVLDLYVGQYVPVNADAKQPDGSYKLNAEESTQDYVAVPALADNATTINLYYDNEVVEDHRAADVTVTHTYTANKTTVQGGAVVILENLPEGNAENSYTGVTGELMFGGATDVIKESYKDNDYTCSNKDAVNMGAVFATGHNPQIDLKYSRDYNDLVAAGYQVNYTYYDWQMTVKNGVAGYYDDASKVKNKMSTSTNVTGTVESPLYVGMKVTLADGVQDGYVTEGNNSSTTPTLQAGENVYNFTFVKKTPLTPATVTVQHSYVLTTISSVGVSKTADPVVEVGSATPDSSMLYPGVTVSAEAVKKDYTLMSVTVKDAAGNDVIHTADEADKVSFSATGTDTVVFNYAKTVDNSIGNIATYKIIDHYRTTDWDGTTEYSNELRTEGSSYGSEKVTYSVRRLGTVEAPLYAVDDVTSPGGSVITRDEISYTMQLKPGENTLNFYYTKTVDTRPEASVIVNHIYRVTDSNAPGGFVQEAVVSEQKFVKAPGQYTAEQEPNRTEGEKTINYTFLSSDHTDCKLDVIFEGNNVINLYYTRNYGEGEGFAVSGTKTYVGLNPDQYPVTTVSLSQNGEQKYSETVINGHFGFANVVPGVYDISESAAVSGYTYTAQYELTANTANALQSRALVQGKVDITGNPQITVVAATEYLLEITNTYTQTITPPPTEPIIPPVEPDNDPEEGYGPGENPLENLETPEVPLADLPETEIPLAELPETEIPETEVPLAEAPATGDNLAMWIMAAAISGLSLVWLMISGKKREDENAE